MKILVFCHDHSFEFEGEAMSMHIADGVLNIQQKCRPVGVRVLRVFAKGQWAWASDTTDYPDAPPMEITPFYKP